MEKKICWTSHEETCQGIFKVLLRISSTWSLQWVCKTTIPDSTYFELQVVIAVCYLGEPRKKSFECHSREQKTAFSELTFELASMLSLQWFCKSLIPDSTYFELKVLRAECVSLESHEKKSVDCRSKEQRRAFSELSFELASMLSMQWFCKIPFPDSPYFELKVLIAECVSLESHKTKICWTLQQGTEKSIFRVIFRISFYVSRKFFCKTLIPDST